MFKRKAENEIESIYDKTSSIDKFLVFLSGLYGLFWFFSLFQDFYELDYGNSFSNVGLIFALYLFANVFSYMSKTIFHDRVFAVSAFALFVYLLLSFNYGSITGMVAATIIAIALGGSKLDTNIVTFGMIGYWVVLLFFSLLNNNLIEAMSNGFMSGLGELLVVFINMGSYSIFEKATSIPGLIFIILFTLLVNGVINKGFENQNDSKESEKEQKKEQKRMRSVETKNNVERPKKIEKTNNKNTRDNQSVEKDEKEVKVNNVEGKGNKENKKEKNIERHDKKFFDIKVPVSFKRFEKVKQDILRKISK